MCALSASLGPLFVHHLHHRLGSDTQPPMCSTVTRQPLGSYRAAHRNRLPVCLHTQYTERDWRHGQECMGDTHTHRHARAPPADTLSLTVLLSCHTPHTNTHSGETLGACVDVSASNVGQRLATINSLHAGTADRHEQRCALHTHNAHKV